ncbi:hypothetical protein M1N64_03195 [Peptococcaceae bacterium]|nr:hypothetical protein [Peptococcaceae bacterium]
MMKIPQLKNSLEGISSKGLSQKRIAEITSAWVTENSIQQIAEQFFADAKSPTESITNTCKAIYKTLVNSGPWGLSALTKMPTSGIDFDNLSESELRKINILPAMIYHGVQTEPAVLMRMNSVPRSIAEPLGNEFAKQTGSAISEQTVTAASNFIRQLKDNDWELALPRGAVMAGADYRQVWQVLSGEEG